MFKRAGELFAELKSETRPRDLVRRMSGGQRQAVAIARTRLSDPKIVLMDEPTAAISVRQVAEVLSLIRRLARAPDRGGADQPPHARCVLGGRPHRRAAPGREGGRQAIAQSSPEEVTGLITGAIATA
jgi:simple sugar transport system ATP-binding protein